MQNRPESLRILVVFIFWVAAVHGAPLHDAVESNDVSRVETLLSHDPTLANSRNDLEQTPLHCLNGTNALRIAKTLLTYRPDLTLEDAYGRSALCRAIERGQAAVAEFLLEAGANDLCSLYEATSRWDTNMVMALLNRTSGQTLRQARATASFKWCLANEHGPDSLRACFERCDYGCSRFNMSRIIAT